MVLVYLADGYEEIEALTPVDCLRRCGIDVKTVGVNSRGAMGSHGITVLCDIVAEKVRFNEDIRMIVLPGGKLGTLNLEKSEYVQNAISYCVENNVPIAAICAAPSILGHRGILRDKNATCYPGFESELDGAKLCMDKSAVTDGNIITGCGMGGSLDFSGEIISKLISHERAEALFKALNRK